MRLFRGVLHRAPVVLLVVGVLLAGACGGDDDEAGPSTTTTRPAASTTSTAGPTSTTSTSGPTSTTASSGPTSTTTAAVPADVEVKAYFLRQEKVGPVARVVAGPAVAAAALDRLLAGPTPAERDLGFATTIPAGTTSSGIALRDRIATVDLSPEFGSGGGSASMQGRVAQVVFTVTQFSTIDAVIFRIDGQPVEALGGEGLILDRPQTRADWESFAPAILVESPLPFATVASPLRVSGSANTFEAMFRIQLKDDTGRILYDRPAMATSGTGTRGTFDVTVPFTVEREGPGSLVVFANSAKDGSPIHVVTIPVRLRR